MFLNSSTRKLETYRTVALVPGTVCGSMQSTALEYVGQKTYEYQGYGYEYRYSTVLCQTRRESSDRGRTRISANIHHKKNRHHPYSTSSYTSTVYGHINLVNSTVYGHIPTSSALMKLQYEDVCDTAMCASTSVFTAWYEIPAPAPGTDFDLQYCTVL